MRLRILEDFQDFSYEDMPPKMSRSTGRALDRRRVQLVAGQDILDEVEDRIRRPESTQRGWKKTAAQDG